jgi:arylsulfatase A
MLPRCWFLAALISAAMAAAVAPVQADPPAAGTAARHPHVVLILADDLGIGDLGCYNPRSKIPTPHLDRLATEGIRFTDAHSPSAVCTPTRYALLTGRYAWRGRLKSGVLYGYSRALIEPGRTTVASLLQEAGYRTVGIGKWHLGLQAHDASAGERPVDYRQPLRPGPLTVGFDRYFGIPASLDMDPYVYLEDDGVVEQPTERIAASQHRRQGGAGFWRGGAIAPSCRHIDVLPTLTERAVAAIDHHAQHHRQQPLFLYVPLSAPHTPWLPTDEYRGRSSAGYYGDFTVQVDATVGKILEALARHEMADEALVIVTSDNGSHWPVEDIRRWDHAANLHYRGQKADIHEGGHRVPFVARWPGRVPAGAVSDELLCLTDMLATLAAVVGLDLPNEAGEDSFNMLPALLDQPRRQPIRPAAIHHSRTGMFAIRQADWKLIEGLGSGGFTAPVRVEPNAGEPAGQLYNLRDDPSEQHNLYAQRPEIVQRLTAQLNHWRAAGRTRPER